MDDWLILMDYIMLEKKTNISYCCVAGFENKKSFLRVFDNTIDCPKQFNLIAKDLV